MGLIKEKQNKQTLCVHSGLLRGACVDQNVFTSSVEWKTIITGW
jgi:hypothetical protein